MQQVLLFNSFNESLSNLRRLTFNSAQQACRQSDRTWNTFETEDY